MLRIAHKSCWLIVLMGCVMLPITISVGAADDTGLSDRVEFVNGEKETGTVLNDTFTVTTPYTSVTLERKNISEIKFGIESGNHDVFVLNTGGLMEGTMEESTLSFELASGEIITLDKKQCKHIVLKKAE